jgi:tetratricopeptide (TPR) repeat protein
LLGQQYFENNKFQDYFNSHFVMLKIDLGTKEGEEIFTRFNITTTPTVMILEPDGVEIDWQVGYRSPPEKFHQLIEKSVSGVETFRYYSDLYAKDPKNVAVVFNLARKYESLNHQDKALALYREIVAADPKGQAGTMDYDNEKVPYTQFAELMIAEASISRSSAKVDPEPLKAFIREYPDSALKQWAYRDLAFVYMSQGTKQEATAFFEEYVAKYPNDLSALSSYVRKIIQVKDNLDRGIELAKKINNQILKSSPNPAYMKDLASLYSLKADKAKAEEVYGKDFMEDQPAALAYNLLDYANFWVGQNANTDSAMAMADLALKIMPDNLFMTQRVATLYTQLNKPERALANFGPEFIKKFMDRPNDLGKYALFWISQDKNLDGALVAAKRTVELAPKSPNMWDLLSIVYQKQKNYDEAIKAAEMALAVAPERSKTVYQKKLEAVKKAKEGK